MITYKYSLYHLNLMELQGCYGIMMILVWCIEFNDSETQLQLQLASC